MIPKTQDLASNKQTEDLKNRNIVESQFVQQEKIDKINSKKVSNTEKTIYNKIKEEGHSNKKEKQKKDNDHRKKDDSSESKEVLEDLVKGHSLDIRI